MMDRVKTIALAALAMAALASVGFHQSPTPEPIRQVVTVEAGDTIYGIACRAADATGKPERIDVNYLAWKIQHDNHITGPGSIQPGTVLSINTEKELEPVNEKDN